MSEQKKYFLHTVGYRNTPDEFNFVITNTSVPELELEYYDRGAGYNKSSNYHCVEIDAKTAQFINRRYQANPKQFASDWFNDVIYVKILVSV